MAPQVSQVFGIESDGDSVKCATDNLHHYGYPTARFFRGRVEHLLRRKIIGPKVPIDTLILDPPRVGCSRAVLDGIADVKPQRIVYVSCNPATLARDLRLLLERGFSLAAVQPVDMFPQTKHVEVVAKLERS